MEEFLVKECVKSTIFRVDYRSHGMIEYGGLVILWMVEGRVVSTQPLPLTSQ